MVRVCCLIIILTNLRGSLWVFFYVLATPNIMDFFFISRSTMVNLETPLCIFCCKTFNPELLICDLTVRVNRAALSLTVAPKDVFQTSGISGEWNLAYKLSAKFPLAFTQSVQSRSIPTILVDGGLCFAIHELPGLLSMRVCYAQSLWRLAFLVNAIRPIIRRFAVCPFAKEAKTAITGRVFLLRSPQLLGSFSYLRRCLASGRD